MHSFSADACPLSRRKYKQTIRMWKSECWTVISSCYQEILMQKCTMLKATVFKRALGQEYWNLGRGKTLLVRWKSDATKDPTLSLLKALKSLNKSTETAEEDVFKPKERNLFSNIKFGKTSDPDNNPLIRPLVSMAKKRKGFINAHPSQIYFQVIGNGASGGPCSLFLYTDHQRYLFNCGEGTQRLFMEHTKSRTLSQMENIFITSKSWKNLGGLLGMCLSMRSSGSPDVTIHGPPGVLDIYDATKSFIVMHNFAVMGHTHQSGVYEDHILTVRHVPLKYDSEPVLPTVPKYSPWRTESTIALTSKGTPINQHPEKEKEPIDQMVCAYLIKFKEKKPRLLIDKCLRMGVPAGPLLGELKEGRDVTLDNGVVVKAADMVDESTGKTQVYIVIECPSEGHLNALANEKELRPENLPDLCCIFHFTPPEVMETEKYSSWINSFSSSVRHVVLNSKSVGYGGRDVLVYSHHLHNVCGEIFHDLLRYRKEDLSKLPPSIPYANIKNEIIQGQAALMAHVYPQTGFIEGNLNIEDVDIQPFLEEVDEVPDYKELLETASKKIALVKSESVDKKMYPAVTFLGTGSSVPSKYRCVSAILVETEPKNFIMLDCGEGTVLQLHRLHGRKGAQEVLCNLRAVYISHLHADHHMGLINIVLEREEAFKSLGKKSEKLIIMGPQKISYYLNTYHHKFQPILTDLFQVSNEHLLESSPPNDASQIIQAMYPSVMKSILDFTKLSSLATSRAHHCPSSFCLSLTTQDGFKLVYSGDTRPNESLVNLGKRHQQTDLLIHEATMEHHMLKDCMSKKHSTFTEAIQEGAAMEAKYTILTHFSQRYSKVPIFEEIEAPGTENVGIAFDNMTVRPRTLGLIRHTFPVLKAVFHEELGEIVTKKSHFTTKNYAEVVVKNLMKDKKRSCSPIKEVDSKVAKTGLLDS